MSKINLPVGTYKLHADPNFNYQLNRCVLGGADLEEISALSEKITDIPSMISVMREAAEKAITEGRTRAAIAYLRTADFFMLASDPEKAVVYDQYKKLYYSVNDALLKDNCFIREDVPYQDGTLPVLYAIPEGENNGTVVMHGGFDSYMEELLIGAVYLYQCGYAVYLFEGPGQGECINFQHMPFTIDWHLPVAAILDYFHLEEVTLVGISFGSLLSKRAAAKEPRIKRLICWGVMSSLFDTLTKAMTENNKRGILQLLESGQSEMLDKIAYGMMAQSDLLGWSFGHGMHVVGVTTPFDYMTVIRKFDLNDVAADITQDYLLIGAAEDHFIPLAMYKAELDQMVNVRSLTYRLFTAKEHAENHCNIGNNKVVLDFIIAWLTSFN